MKFFTYVVKVLFSFVIFSFFLLSFHRFHFNIDKKSYFVGLCRGEKETLWWNLYVWSLVWLGLGLIKEILLDKTGFCGVKRNDFVYRIWGARKDYEELICMFSLIFLEKLVLEIFCMEPILSNFRIFWFSSHNTHLGHRKLFCINFWFYIKI